MCKTFVIVSVVLGGNFRHNVVNCDDVNEGRIISVANSDDPPLGINFVVRIC